ncbi:MAG: B12-binding domain-containing radical SAM protein [Candidatus Omnitrophica bacterium]|nr:B12-binding domain-containing radical SAM protein [Candidatus Omnitrophota bacterium]
MSKRILLIQPRTGSWDVMSMRFPESLLAVAAVPRQKGYEVDLLDQRLDRRWKTTLVKLLSKKPVLVGITSMTGEQIGYMLDVLRAVKRVSSVPTVLGGIHATILPRQSVEHPLVDVVCEGEGDIALYEIAEALYEKKDLYDVKGIYFKKEGSVIYTGKRDMIKDLDSLPMLPYEILSMDRYSVFEIGKGRSATVFTSRGCPYRCKFCASPVVSPTWRPFSVKRVMENVKLLQERYGMSNIYFQDDNLAGSLSRFRELIGRLASMDKKIRWGTLGIRADAIDKLTDDDMKILLESGCHDLDIGVESGSQRVNKFIGKDESLDTIASANKKLAHYPIIAKYTFMAGFPTETEREVGESVNFAINLCRENKNAYTLFFVFAPIVGTEFYKLALEYGFKEPKGLEEWRYLQLDGWLEKYPNWLNKKEIKRVQALSFVSYFANQNVSYKFTKLYMRIIFLLYHPIARFRFRNQFFFLFIEGFLHRAIFGIKSFVERVL